jgi:hypothetical protein
MLNKNVRRCTHIKTNGIQCGAPALRGWDWCFFHRQAKLDFPRRQVAKDTPEPVIDLALIDDPDGIHYALMQVMQGIANGTLTGKAPGHMLYALQIMSSNFKQTSFQRQLDAEFSSSELNAYEMWEKMGVEIEERNRKRQHEKRVEELKRLERTCCKCREESEDPASLMPPIPPDPNAKPVESDDEDEEEQWEIKACAEDESKTHHGNTETWRNQLKIVEAWCRHPSGVTRNGCCNSQKRRTLRPSAHSRPGRLASDSLRVSVPPWWLLLFRSPDHRFSRSA